MQLFDVLKKQQPPSRRDARRFEASFGPRSRVEGRCTLAGAAEVEETKPHTIQVRGREVGPRFETKPAGNQCCRLALIQRTPQSISPNARGVHSRVGRNQK